jgi:hypothetical protein
LFKLTTEKLVQRDRPELLGWCSLRLHALRKQGSSALFAGFIHVTTGALLAWLGLPLLALCLLPAAVAVNTSCGKLAVAMLPLAGCLAGCGALLGAALAGAVSGLAALGILATSWFLPVAGGLAAALLIAAGGYIGAIGTAMAATVAAMQFVPQLLGVAQPLGALSDVPIPAGFGSAGRVMMDWTADAWCIEEQRLRLALDIPDSELNRDPGATLVSEAQQCYWFATAAMLNMTRAELRAKALLRNIHVGEHGGIPNDLLRAAGQPWAEVRAPTKQEAEKCIRSYLEHNVAFNTKEYQTLCLGLHSGNSSTLGHMVNVEALINEAGELVLAHVDYQLPVSARKLIKGLPDHRHAYQIYAKWKADVGGKSP